MVEKEKKEEEKKVLGIEEKVGLDNLFRKMNSSDYTGRVNLYQKLDSKVIELKERGYEVSMYEGSLKNYWDQWATDNRIAK